MNVPQFLKYLKLVYDKHGGGVAVKVKVHDKVVGQLNLPIQLSDLKLVQLKDKSVELVIDMT